VKRRELIARLEAVGFTLLRHGSKHDVYARRSGEQEPIPRHREVNEKLAEGDPQKVRRLTRHVLCNVPDATTPRQMAHFPPI
jgi:mRNA interferase HicA